jgi:hypothetical protein
MTMPTRPTREQLEAYWYQDGVKPPGYDYWYDNINEQEDEDEEED